MDAGRPGGVAPTTADTLRPVTRPSTNQDLSSIRYLSAADVEAAMPPVEEQIRLARVAMEALDGRAELPAKIGVHPRPEASFGHAMPAWLRGSDTSDDPDLLGMKWVVGFPTNDRLGLPAIHGTVLLNDARTGVPRAILDAGPITAHRTAAVSGVTIERWGRAVNGRPLRVGLVGAGVQGRSHLPVLQLLLPGSELAIASAHPEHAAALAEHAERLGGFGAISVAGDPAAAIDAADVVITMISFGMPRQIVPAEAFMPGALVVAVDYDMCVPAVVAQGASWFLVDERGQYLATRSTGRFEAYPDPSATIGEALRGGASRPPGTMLVAHLGVGLADLVFADPILRAAEAQGLGTPLDR
jgi:ornithine cyclodeaminase/alanine dehydrogenase-like protein (mu-crystallin family)